MDLPTPGSPPSTVTEPATRPPPRTLSSSPMPVAAATALSALIEHRGNAVAQGTEAHKRRGSVARPESCPRCERCHRLFHEGVPLTTGRAASGPSRRAVSACPAAVNRLRSRHVLTLRAGCHTVAGRWRRLEAGENAQESAPAPANSTAGGSKPSMARKTRAPSSSSTITVSPTRNSFQRIFSESGSSTSCWIERRKGLAPSSGRNLSGPRTSWPRG